MVQPNTQALTERGLVRFETSMLLLAFGHADGVVEGAQDMASILGGDATVTDSAPWVEPQLTTIQFCTVT